MPIPPPPFTERVPRSLLSRSSVHPRSIELWNLSQNRYYDTFIGLTDITDGTFHMRPCVKATNDPLIYESLFLDPRTNRARRTAKIAAESYYGANDIIVVPDQIAGNLQGVDGFAHRTLCNRVLVSQANCLGWGIIGNAGGQSNPEGGFSSGRNMGKFQLVNGRPNYQEGRDLPSTWAQFVLDKLKRDLGNNNFIVNQNKWPGVR